MSDESPASNNTGAQCPKCGYVSSNPEVCDACGAIFARVRGRQAREDFDNDAAGLPASRTNPYGSGSYSPPGVAPAILGIAAVVVAVLLIAYRLLAPGSAPSVIDPLPESLMPSEGEKATLVEFWAAWCGPCQVFAPVIEAVESDYRGKLKVVRINVDEEQEITARFKVSAFPAVYIVDPKGRVLLRTLGAVPKSELYPLIDRAMGK